MKPITVLLADDHTIVREGIRKLLELDGNIQVVAEAKNGREAVLMTAKFKPDVVVMDIAMPSLNGLEATRQLIKALSSSKVLILSAHCDDAYVESAAEAGACGFLLKQTSAHEVCRAIHEIGKGKTCFGAEITRRAGRINPAPPGREAAPNMKAARLTAREMEVLQLIAEGKANKETASELGIGLKTVEKHREHLMAKLDIHDTASLTRYAIGAGVIESSVQTTFQR